ncbi:MAG: glycosyltransferase, partial [Gammaproteobacteria bacterium]|nr:glycosyltransferase [Gammaproteobacteria bacterium]
MAADSAPPGAAPVITVLMPVFNGGRFIGEAIESILGQTFTDFELLVINDGSTDDSLAVIGEYAARDRRIRVVSRENRGLVATLNEGLGLARGAYLARMDCDDISFPARLRRQYDFMRAHPQYILCGSNSFIVNRSGRLVKKWGVPIQGPDDFRRFCCFSTPFVHSSAFLDLGRLRAEGFQYDARYSCAEDFALWGRISRRHACTVLDDYLVAWRDHREGVCRSRRDRQMLDIADLVEKNIADEWPDVAVANDVFLNLLRDDESTAALDEAARLSNELIALLEHLPEKSREVVRLGLAVFLNRVVVEIAYIHGLDRARYF